MPITIGAKRRWTVLIMLTKRPGVNLLALERGVGCGARGRRLSPLAPLSTVEILDTTFDHECSFPALLPFLRRIESPWSSMR